MRRRSSWQLIAVFKIRFKLCTTFKALQDHVNCLEILGFYSFPSGFLQLILFPPLFFFLSAPSPNSSFILRYYLDYCFYFGNSFQLTIPFPRLSIAFLNEPMAPRSVLNSLGSYYTLSGSPQQRTHLSTWCPGPLVSNAVLSLCSLAPQLLILLLAHAG